MSRTQGSDMSGATATQPRWDARDGGDPGPTRPGLLARVSAWLAVVVLVLTVGAVWIRDAGVLDRVVVAQVLVGPVERQTDDGAWEGLPPGTELWAGDVVRTGPEQGVLELGSGRLRLASGSRVTLEEPDALQVAAGAVLLEVDDLVTVRWGLVSATGRGTWRLGTSEVSRVGVYRGGVAVRDEQGRERSLGRLQQVGLTGGTVEEEVLPLRYVASDPWDARLLAGALTVDRFVVQLQQSLTVDYGRGPRPASFYRAFRADPAVVRGVLRGAGRGQVRPPARILTGILVAQTLVRRAGLAPAEAVGEMVSLREQGAAWGLLLARHDLGVDALRDTVDLALQPEVDERDGGTDEGEGGAQPQTGEPDGDEGTGPSEGGPGDGGGEVDGARTDGTDGDGGTDTDGPASGPAEPSDGATGPDADGDESSLLGRLVDLLDVLLPGDSEDDAVEGTGDLLFNGGDAGTRRDGAGLGLG